jgi:N-glycosylase/DNA lyase
MSLAKLPSHTGHLSIGGYVGDQRTLSGCALSRCDARSARQAHAAARANASKAPRLSDERLHIPQTMTIDKLWSTIAVSPSELLLARVLRCGQTFRWKNIDDTWAFTLSDRIVLLRQDNHHIHYSAVLGRESATSAKTQAETLQFIHDYFNLSTNLSSLYEHWLRQHAAFGKGKKTSPFDQFAGIRILRQDPWETTVLFICSSNNNVKRISKMCDTLCTEFGTYINSYEGIDFYLFPTATKLAESSATEARLRLLGFGYRAKYIYQTANLLTSTLSVTELDALRLAPYAEAHSFLLQLLGVGPKVADCICLMALDKHDVVPVDTHVYQIAIRDYKFSGKRDLKTMNKKIYEDIRRHFKEIFGEYAGWAQSVLFTSDLVDLNNGVNIASGTPTPAVVLATEVKSESIEITAIGETDAPKRRKMM